MSLFRIVSTGWEGWTLRYLHCKPLRQLLTRSSSNAGTSNTGTSNTGTSNATTQDEWKPIYRLPMAGAVSVFNRLKVYQGLFTLLGFPMAVIMATTGQVDAQICTIFLSIGVTTTITLSVASLLSTNLIGFVYVNRIDETKLRFAFMDFWGRRQHVNISMKAMDIIVPGSPLLHNIYRSVVMKSQETDKNGNTVNKIKTFKLLPEYGKVMDREAFHSVFGD